MKRLVAVILMVVLCAGLYGGVSALKPDRFLPGATQPRVNVDFLPENEVDVVRQVLGYPDDTTLLTVNGQDVTAEVYCYWLGNITSYYQMMMAYGGQELDLDAELEPGVTWGSQLKEIAYNNCVLSGLTTSLAKEYGVSLTAEDIEALVADRADSIAQMGGEKYYAYQLQAMGISDKTAFELDKAGTLFTKLQEAYLQKATTDGTITDETVAEYVAENDILRAKHILLLTRDMTTGEDYDAETQAEQKDKADQLLAQLKADPSQFDQLMQANSEDTGLAQNPDGYTFTSRQMVASFEEGVRALEYGQISEVIQSEYGYHILLRLDPDSPDLRQKVAEESFNDLTTQWLERAQVTKTPEYEALSTKDFFTKLAQFQDSLPAPEPETEQPEAGQPDSSATSVG